MKQTVYPLKKKLIESFVFPKGAKELDEALVSEPLEWLQEYPKSRKEWVGALKLYADIPSENPSEVADKFRKALERFFQEFFKSEKSLENMKSEYGDFLTSKGVPAEIKNNLEKILDLYAKYMNNYAKHHDKTGQNVLEYILYASGYAELVTAEELPPVCLITAEVEPQPGTRQFGLRFRYDLAEDISYAMCFRPDKAQWRCITMPGRPGASWTSTASSAKCRRTPVRASGLPCCWTMTW